jgi:carbonic anhydrase
LRTLLLTLLLIFAVAIVAPLGPRAQWRTPWSYSGKDGPAHWAALDSEYAACGGQQQSPIDIRDAKKASLPALRFEFKSGPLVIINNGYTAVRVNYSPGNGNFLIVGGKAYELTQFHFHHPSEEEINGKAFAMNMHFMYQSADGEVAAVAVMVNAGNADRARQGVVRQLWKYMPPVAGKEHLIPGVEINPAALLPRDLGYYAYMGSQTAPPCTEGVKWFVLKTPVEIAPAQIAAFAKLYPDDVRPVQPLHGRAIEESVGAD